MGVPGTDQMLLTSVSRISRLCPENLAVVDFDGNVLDGKMDPTAAEIVAMHAVVYKHKTDVRAAAAMMLRPKASRPWLARRTASSVMSAASSVAVMSVAVNVWMRLDGFGDLALTRPIREVPTAPTLARARLAEG